MLKLMGKEIFIIVRSTILKLFIKAFVLILKVFTFSFRWWVEPQGKEKNSCVYIPMVNVKV